MPTTPDVLVLGGGGVLGEAWMLGVLGGIEDGAGLDLRRCECRVATADGRSARRVVFGSPRSPSASVSEAVAASCTVPWLFAPVEIEGTEYVDGGVWSPTNLDAAPAGRGAHVLCLNPTASLSAS